jgi:hypothetical protein
MNCRINNKCIVEVIVMPLTITLVSFIGGCYANKISENYNKAEALSEFLPFLVNGTTGERVVAKIALKPYLSKQEWIDIEWGVQQKIQDDLIKALEKNNPDKATDAAASLKKLFPKGFQHLAKGTLDEKDLPSSKLIDDRIKNNSTFRNQLYETINQPAILEINEYNHEK